MQEQSRGEIKVESILQAAGLHYEKEFVIDELVTAKGRHLRFDFAVFDDVGALEFLIEYQGEQHYMAVDHFKGKSGLSKQKYNDRRKAVYCAEHNIPLVAIPYYDYNIVDYDYIITRANYF